jgi:hypothetical protein
MIRWPSRCRFCSAPMAGHGACPQCSQQIERRLQILFAPVRGMAIQRVELPAREAPHPDACPVW